MSGVMCDICPHACVLEEGQAGFCRARVNRGGRIIAGNYGQITSMALDPIEKKPLSRFYPGSRILSVGSYGCNMRCPYCQNHEISMADAPRTGAVYVSPEALVQKALQLVQGGNIGIAFTYNEPLVGYEYVRDCAVMAKEQQLKTVLVTNGLVNEAPLLKLLPLVDAMNIDLKGFDADAYKALRGDLEATKRTIALSVPHCHVEVTTLVVPGRNDQPEEMDVLAAWLASVDADIPLHISRFFPRYHMTDADATKVQLVYSLANVARRHLRYVYEGNC